MLLKLKTLPVLLLILMATAIPAWAQKAYVTDELVVTIRVSKSPGAAIVTRARSMEALQLVEMGDKWAKVRKEDGKEGWVQKRYLTTEKPAGLKLKQTEAQNQKLADRLRNLENENKSLTEANLKLEAELKKESAAKAKLDRDYKQLGREAAGYLELKQEYDRTKAELEAKRSEVAELTTTSDESVNTRRLKWFVAGGSVLVAGWLVGIFSARRRKNPSRFY